MKLDPISLVFVVCCIRMNGVFGTAYFTTKPPPLQYVLQGTNAIFGWDYNRGSSGELLTGTWGVDGSGSYCMLKLKQTSGYSLFFCHGYSLRDKATMVLQNVSVNMTAKYFCQLVFSVPNQVTMTSTASLNVVRRLPTFTMLPTQQNLGIEGGRDVIISTEVVGDYPPVIQWYRNDALVNTSLYPNSSRLVGTNAQNETIVQSNLTIKSPTRNSGGRFMARAVFGTHSPAANTSFSIQIWYGPEKLSISSSKSGMGIAQGQSVIVTCSATSFPPSRYTFYRNGTVVLENSTSGILTISSFTRNDIGNYSCFVENEVSNGTISGVWFFFVEEPPTTTTTRKPTLSSTTDGEALTTTKSSNVTSSPGNRTSAADESIPWWVWLAVGLALLLIISIVIIVIFYIKRRRTKKKSSKGNVMKFSKGIDLDSYIQNTNYPPGYEDAVQREAKMQNGFASNDMQVDGDPGKTNLGIRFESEHDLIEHYRKGPETEDEFDDVDFKDHDPFEDDEVRITDHDPFESDYREARSFDNGVFEHDDEVYKENSESERDSEKNPDLFVNVNQDFIQYEI
ncbi:uncharacterized protein LOC135684863 isoform X1 [Rhopilema esculentum]|uniref:uncharacterized protein LOC135684863 isoform X1 n=1 Tax=Rhopilema esculentum TaxID=499914 RepID=UPI0031CEE07E